MAKRKPTVPSEKETVSAFVPLPIPHGDMLRILGPKPSEAAVTVDPLVKLDTPLGVVQSFIGGVCDGRGRLLQPLEIVMVVDPAMTTVSDRVPTAAILETFDAWPELRAGLPANLDSDLLRAALVDTPRVGPLLYCRKRHCVFAARSPETGEPLQACSAGEIEDACDVDGKELPSRLLSWSDVAKDTTGAAGSKGGKKGRKRGGEPEIYASKGGTCSAGPIVSLDDLLLGQGMVISHIEKLSKTEPVAADGLAREHACSGCPERQRCYPKGDGYAYAADRLVAISAAVAPVVVTALGEWRLDEACRVIGGLSTSRSLQSPERADNEFETWRDEQARAIERAGPARLLAGETDGRELLEVARLKLGLIADVLEQLDATWYATKRPHLCWNGETVRVSWRWPVATPGACWGFQALLRKAGLHPDTRIASADSDPLPFPPAFSDAAYLPLRAAEAARYFGEPRRATLFVKKPQAGDGTGAHVLLEGLGIPWELFTTSDTMQAAGDGWQAVLSPAAQRGPDDGEGLPFTGRVSGRSASLKKGDQAEGVECHWYPRFGEAVDLHAVGMLLFEALLTHDERSPQAFREQLGAEATDLARACLELPPEQREQYARNWITERCESDAPAALWSRRNLLFRRDDRNATRLDAFGAPLWKEVVVLALRLTTNIRGFSYCDDRACAAPRLGEDLLLPLIELRGLIALLDDVLFKRAVPVAVARERIAVGQ